MEKHKYHIAKLEAIMRIVDNDAIELGQVCQSFDKIHAAVKYTWNSDEEEIFSWLGTIYVTSSDS